MPEILDVPELEKPYFGVPKILPRKGAEKTGQDWPIQLPRGWLAGGLGLAGDIEGSLRDFAAQPHRLTGHEVDTQPFFRKTEDWLDALPLKGATKGEEQVAEGASLFGGVGAGTALKAPVKLAEAVSALPARNLSPKALQRGAVTLGGVEDAVASHSSYQIPNNIEEIRKNGLFAPSIGLSKASGNAYQTGAPSLIFRAGDLDKHFPNEAPGGIFNRDAYLWNPSRTSGEPVKLQWERRLAGLGGDDMGLRLSKGLGDARLSQVAPDAGPHTAAILMSPKFKNLAEWENATQGYGALKSNKEGYHKMIGDYEHEFNDVQRNFGGDPEQFFAQMVAAYRQGLTPAMLAGSELGRGMGLARRAPSQMGEMKIYAPSVPAGPEHASIYVPELKPVEYPNSWRTNAEHMADQGYEVYGPEHLAGLAGDRSVANSSWNDMPVHLLAPSSGQRPIPASEALRMYKDLQPPKIHAQGWDPNDMTKMYQGVDSAVADVIPKPPKLPAKAASESKILFEKMKQPDWTWTESDPKASVKDNLVKEFGMSEDQAAEIYQNWVSNDKTTLEKELQKFFLGEVPKKAPEMPNLVEDLLK